MAEVCFDGWLCDPDRVVLVADGDAVLAVLLARGPVLVLRGAGRREDGARVALVAVSIVADGVMAFAESV